MRGRARGMQQGQAGRTGQCVPSIALSVLVFLAAGSASAAIPASELELYVFEVPKVVPASAADDAIARIRRQVRRIVRENRHDLTGARLWGTANQLLWGHGRAVASTAQAMPYLDDALASKVKAYLAVEIDRYLLDRAHLDSEVKGSLGTVPGAKRFGISWDRNDAFRWEALYGLWAYAHYTGDWERIRRNWPKVKGVFNSCRPNGRRWLGVAASTSAVNSEIAGLIGMARMARHLGYDAAAKSVVEVACRRLDEKLAEVDAAPDFPVQLLGTGEMYTLYVIGCQDLTPDLCRVLAAFRKRKLATQFGEITDRFRTWFLSDMDHVADWMENRPFLPVTFDDKGPGEESFQMSLFASPIYLVRAYVTREPVETLRYELPMGQSSRTTPHYLDMLRLQHLVALAHRQSRIAWRAE